MKIHLKGYWVYYLVIACNVGISQDALEIVKKADEKMRGNTAKIEMTIMTTRPGWQRSMDLKAWTKGTEFSLILITAAAKDKGVSFLKRKKRSVELVSDSGKGYKIATIHDESKLDGN